VNYYQTQPGTFWMKIKAILTSLILSSCASYKSTHEYVVRKDVSYGENERQVGDLYLAKNKDAPLVLTVHGGSWSSRSHKDMNNLAESLASHGYNVFNISYRFAPEHHYPAQIDDLAKAIDFIKTSFKDSMNFEKIGLWGYSAGAQITLMHALKKDTGISAVVAGGGPYDFTWWPGSPLITPYMGYGRDENIQGWLDASPITHLHKDAPSLFLYHGKEDELVGYGQMTSLDARAKLLGIDIETYVVEFWGHAFTFVFSKEALKRGILFLNDRLKS